MGIRNRLTEFDGSVYNSVVTISHHGFRDYIQVVYQNLYIGLFDVGEQLIVVLVDGYIRQVITIVLGVTEPQPRAIQPFGVVTRPGGCLQINATADSLEWHLAAHRGGRHKTRLK